MTWPLITRMNSAMIGLIGDNIYFVWMLGWFKKALFELGVNPFNVWFLNYPEGWNMAYTEITPVQLAISLPFTFLGGPTFAYNAGMLLSFTLSGLTMYLWVRHLTHSYGPALLAGFIYAFLPFHMAHFLIGHLNLVGLQWFPLFFWGFLDLLNTPSGKSFSRSSLWLTGLGLGLISLTSQYYVYMTLLIAAGIFIVFLIKTRRWKDLNLWKNLLLSGLIALPFVLAAIAPYVMLLGKGGLPNRDISIVRMYSASPTDFILPSTDHFLWGQWVGKNFNRDMWVEGTLYIGLVSGFLAALAWLKRRDIQPLVLSLMAWGGFLALILAMGTDLHWNGQPVTLPTPSFLQSLVQRPDLPLVLPGFFLFKYFPLYAKLRALMRFGVFVLLFTSAGAGLGAAWLLLRLPTRRQMAALGLLFLLVFVDFYPGPYREFTTVEARPVDTWLAAQPGQGAVAQFPFSIAEDQEQTYYTLVHNKPYIGGFFNAFPPAQYQRIKPVLNHFPDTESVQLLRELKVEYILLQTNLYPNLAEVEHECENQGLKRVTEVDGQAVYKFTEQ
jgi:hypothetical protein